MYTNMLGLCLHPPSSFEVSVALTLNLNLLLFFFTPNWERTIKEAAEAVGMVSKQRGWRVRS